MKVCEITGKVAIVLNGIRNEVNAGDGVSIALNPGSYSVGVINLLTGEVKNQTVNVVERIIENYDLTVYYGSDNPFCGNLLVPSAPVLPDQSFSGVFSWILT